MLFRSGPGLIETLMAVAAAAPAYQPLHAMELNANELRLKGPVLPSEVAAALVSQLATQGLRARVQGELLTIGQGDSP